LKKKTYFYYLGHSIDTWTKEDVKKWFEYCIEEYSLGDINLNDFQMNGLFNLFSLVRYIHLI
jgi:hypothetical protein